MAAFTQLDAASIAALADAFELGAVDEWHPIAAGTINSNFSLRASSGRFFLRINEGKAEVDVRYEADVVAALAGAGVPTPVPLSARTGEPFARHDGKYASAFPWIDGVHRCQAGVTPADVRAVGRALAQLHRAGEPLAARFDRAGIYTFDAIAARFESFRGLGDPALAEAVTDIADEITWLRERAPVRDAAARGIIHADLFRDNVLFGEAGVAALIDFEQACTGSLAYDLAVVINAWCYGDDFDATLVRAAVAGYQSVRELPPADRVALPIECRAAAMRFTVTRITDIHLQDTTSTKDFRRYQRRLRRWRELGSGSDAGLDFV
jgi:homoserine kinase type II